METVIRVVRLNSLGIEGTTRVKEDTDGIRPSVKVYEHIFSRFCLKKTWL
jgi:hypothetical protein